MTVGDRTHKLFGRVVEDAQRGTVGTMPHVNYTNFLLAEIAQDIKHGLVIQEAILMELQLARYGRES